MIVGLWSVLLWLGITLFGVGMTWVSRKRIYIHDHTWWGRWFLIHQDSGRWYLQISFDDLGHQGTFVNYQLIFYLTLLMAAYGNMSSKLLGDDGGAVVGFRWWHLLGYLSIPIFGLLGQVRGMEFSVVPGFWSRLSLQAKCACVLLVCFLSCVLSWQLWLAYCDHMVWGYLFGLIVVPLVYYVVYQSWVKSSGHSWHVHHWFIGYYWSGVVRYGDPYGISMFLMMIFWGVFLEGSIYYGATPII